MLDTLLLFAGVNLIVAFAGALWARTRRPGTARWLLLLAVPALWVVCALATFFYFRATMPPPSAIPGPSGHYIITHGNVALILWDERVSMADGVALFLTAATLLILLSVEVARSVRTRQRRDRIA